MFTEEDWVQRQCQGRYAEYIRERVGTDTEVFMG
jgi:hypothetical protein